MSQKMKLLFTISFSLAFSALIGQSFDEIISSNRYIDCRDVTHNALPITEKLYHNNQIDSLYQFIDYWESKCGFLEPAFRLRNILKIRTNKFETDSISDSMIELLILYRRKLENNDFYQFHNRIRLRSDPYLTKSPFDSFTQKIASTTTSSNLDESLLLDFYTKGSPTFKEIKEAANNSRLKQHHTKIYNKTLWQPQFHLALVTGVIQNYGDLSIFGTRPVFGFVLGGKQLRHNFDLILDFRAGPSKEEYTFIYEDSLISEDTWTGMYVGAEYTFDFIHSEKLDVGISPGIGYDRITALTIDNDYGEDAKFLSSFNKNIGLVFKYKYGKQGGYVGLHFRYNLTNYDNPGGTELKGKYLNIRFTIGSIFDYWRDSKLKYLE